MIDPAYFERKRRELGMDRADFLTEAQAVLERWYPGRVRVRQFHRGVVRVVTESSSVAGELRLRQLELVAALEQLAHHEPIQRIAIAVGSLKPSYEPSDTPSSG
jgi:hypothetical protein